MQDGNVKLTRRIVTCPACGEKVKATAINGEVSGWCAVTRKQVHIAKK